MIPLWEHAMESQQQMERKMSDQIPADWKVHFKKLDQPKMRECIKRGGHKSMAEGAKRAVDEEKSLREIGTSWGALMNKTLPTECLDKVAQVTTETLEYLTSAQGANVVMKNMEEQPHKRTKGNKAALWREYQKGCLKMNSSPLPEIDAWFRDYKSR